MVKPIEASYSYEQKCAIALIAKFSSSLSIIGSSYIIYHVYVRKVTTRSVSSVYKRLLVSLSLCDLIGSLGFFIGTWAIPKDDQQDLVVFNMGDRHTCNIQGFMLQFGVVAVAIYNASLSVYFLLVTKYRMSDDKLRKTAEPFFHLISTIFPFISALVCLKLDLYNSTPAVCWIGEYPRGCVDDECIRGENYAKLRAIFFLIPIALCISIITVSMCMLYKSVHKIERASNQYSMRWTSQNSSGNQSNRVFRKALFFILAFATVWVPAIFQTIIAKVVINDQLVSFVLAVIFQIFVPLQGILNFLIYREINPFNYVASSILRISTYLQSQQTENGQQGD